MKKYIFTLLILCATFNSISQSLESQLGQDEVLLKVKLVNRLNREPLSEDIEFKDLKTGKITKLKTNSKGFTQAIFQENTKLEISYNNAPSYCYITLPEEGYIIVKKELKFEGSNTNSRLYPNTKMGLINLKFFNEINKPIGGEKFTIESVKTGKLFLTETTNKGEAQVLVPLDADYIFHHEYYPNFRKVNISLKDESDGFAYYLSIMGEESSTRKKRELKIDAINKLNDSIVKLNFINDVKTIRSTENAKKLAEEYNIKIKNDPLFFNSKKLNVLAVFNRKRKEWNDNKAIVIDVTWSMSPSMYEVAIWLAMNKNSSNEYFLFNDKNGLEGGTEMTNDIYQLKDTNEVNDLYYSMLEFQKKCINNYDTPENDLPALLHAQEATKKKKDLILIADNLGGLKYPRLISKIKTPVHIIMCNTKSDPIHPDYLTLAKQTKGSIHTLEEDIEFNQELKEGETITIVGSDYIIRNGAFEKIEK